MRSHLRLLLLLLLLLPVPLTHPGGCGPSDEPPAGASRPDESGAAPAALAQRHPSASAPSYPLHRNITATVFWVGEPADRKSKSPSNAASAWDSHWQAHFGGFDDPKRRSGYRPAGFTPKENPFYVALPYNDFKAGKRRPDVERVIPWAGRAARWGRRESMCKNRWVRISRGANVCYAQWEDVGPFVTDDAAYVFGTARPRNTSNRGAGIDVSPAVRDYLGLTGNDAVDWRFVDTADVPAGPWKQVVTTSQISWQ